MANKRKYISTEYGLVNLRDGDWVIHLDPEVLAELYWEVQDGKLVRVIRCKDCQYYYVQPRGFSPICKLTRSRAEKEGYCAWAERKEDE